MKPLRLILFLSAVLFLPNISLAETIRYQVPFVSQAPRGNWKDMVFKDACEETSLIMVEAWMMGQILDPRDVELRLHQTAAWEVQRFGFHQDTSVFDTYLLATEYFHLPGAEYRENITTQDIISALADKNLVLVAVNASKLYKKGPQRHMIIVTGFDEETRRFVFNDPMLAKGGNLAVSEAGLQAALRDYPSGIHKTVLDQKTAMISFHWPWVLGPK